jgi:hypothetical protein
MITRDLGITHVGWNAEFYPNGVFKRGKTDWMNIKGVAADMTHPIKDQDIVLMHDRHWVGKEKSLNELITFLSSRYNVTPLDNKSGNSRAVKRAQ